MIETMAATLSAQITPQAIFAMLGGLMGGCLIALPKSKQDGLFISIVFIFFGTAMSLAASDYILINLDYNRIGAHTALGTAVGCVGGSMMMAIRAIAPSFAEKLVNIGAKTVIGFAESKDRVKQALIALLGKDK